MTNEPNGERIREAVREYYAAAARQVLERQPASCCPPSSCCSSTSCCSQPVEDQAWTLYEISQLEGIPEAATLASLGCGNPTLLADLQPGETVLDLGSGGGIDVLLSAKRVGPTGKAYGLDMTDEMLQLARRNAAEAGVKNVEFLKGHIESIPLPDASVDVIISNCVINLSADKDAVLREAYRVLKPGGRFAVADIVIQGAPLPAALRQMLTLWADCLAGALTESEYRQKLTAAGFSRIGLTVLQTYGLEDIPVDLRQFVPADLSLGNTKVVSAFVSARKAV